VKSEEIKNIYAPFEGTVPVVEINVKQGDRVIKGQVLAAVEALKAKHDVKSPCDGIVREILENIGNEVEAGNPILTIIPEGN